MYKIYFGSNMVLITDKTKWDEYFTDGLLLYCTELMCFTTICSLIEKSKALKKVYFIGENTESTFEMVKKNFKVIESAGGLVKNSKGEYLAIKRRGKWDLPKGKIESFEQCHDAAIRETYEETGLLPLDIISILPPTYHVYWEDGKHILKKTFWYEMLYQGMDEPIPQEQEGITAVKWLKRDEFKIVTDNTFHSVLDVLRSAKLI